MKNISVPVVDGRVDMTSGFMDPGRPQPHRGADFFPSVRGTKLPVLSFDDGTVSFVQRGNPTAGNWIEIRHGSGLTTTYMHLDGVAPGMAVGRMVAGGERIGTMGDSGRATCIHLHLETRWAWERDGGRNAFDPMPMLLARMAEKEREARPMRIAISSGHGLHVRGASKLIDEVDEARRVADRLGDIMPGARIFHDDTTRAIKGNVRQAVMDNVSAIVGWHNSLVRDVDVSVHFNSVDGGIRDAGIGVETLHRKGNDRTRELASRVSRGISEASGLILRRGDGTWAQTGLGFLNNTNLDRAVLIEVCFVNSRTDVRLYKENFEAICRSIAGSLTGQSVAAATQLPAPPAASTPPPTAAGRDFRVLVGAFGTREEAEAVRDRVRQEPGREKAWLVEEGGMWHVQAASGPNLDGAERIARELLAAGIMGVLVV